MRTLQQFCRRLLCHPQRQAILQALGCKPELNTQMRQALLAILSLDGNDEAREIAFRALCR